MARDEELLSILKKRMEKFKKIREKQKEKNLERNLTKEEAEAYVFNKQSTTQPHQIHGPHFFFPFRYRT
jgi:hypothetical protein